MPMTINNGADDFKKRVEAFKAGIKEMLPIVGEIARDEIVRSTLAGIAEGDAAFTPYSKGYAELTEAVGGKTSGVVDLRGIFVHSGTTKAKKEIRRKGLGNIKVFDTPEKRARLAKEANRQKRLLRKGGFRQAYVRVTISGKSFFAKTAFTRPRRSLEDTDSEMSTDLIKVTTNATGIKLVYSPRHTEYMIWHQEGEGKLPKRVWFSVEKANVKGAVQGALSQMFQALIADFNR